MQTIMPQHNQRFQAMLEKLRNCDCRITPQRIAILKILSSSTDHPSVESIYDHIRPEFPTMSLATVYKTILLLKEIGEVLELEFSNDRNRYDGFCLEPHPHLICTECKQIVDLDLIPMCDITSQLAQKTAYTIVSHRLDFFGICPKCRRDQ